MACARPIIAGLDGEGARIVTEAGAGISCGAENPEKLAKAILTIYNAPENIRDKMGQDGRKYFDAHFERNRLLKKLDQLMRKTERNMACRAF